MIEGGDEMHLSVEPELLRELQIYLGVRSLGAIIRR